MVDAVREEGENLHTPSTYTIMQRSQIYLSIAHLKALAVTARARGTTNSALIREALDQYLARQTPAEKRSARMLGFGAWASNADAPSLAQLRSEERHF